jgi:hypothetical protein
LCGFEKVKGVVGVVGFEGLKRGRDRRRVAEEREYLCTGVCVQMVSRKAEKERGCVRRRVPADRRVCQLGVVG